METLFGVATHVCRTAAVYGNQNGVETIQTVTFRIGSRAVEVSLPESPQIDEGDEVAVAGDMRRGKLKARAYMNRTNGSYDRRRVPSNSVATLLVTITFGVVGRVMSPGMEVFFLCLAPIPAIWFLWDVRQFMKNRRALRLARSQAKRAMTRPVPTPLAV